MTTTHRISTTAAIILSVATLGAPAASARPVGLDAASAANGQSSTAVRPNPDQQTATGATANRIPAGYSRQDKSIVASASPSATSGIAHATALPAVVRLQAPASGFDWGDAGIGAVGGIALSMIGLGGALVVSQNRARRTRGRRGTTAIPS